MDISCIIMYRVTLDGLLHMVRKFSMKIGWISDTTGTSAKILVSVVLLLLLISQHQCCDDYADLWRLQ